jgi:hypothetical protein
MAPAGGRIERDAYVSLFAIYVDKTGAQNLPDSKARRLSGSS